VKENEMKRPKWTDRRPEIVCHPSAPLKDAAKALELDSVLANKAGQRASAQAAKYYAMCLRKVSEGKTWAEAFQWPDAE
jgi:hypothetical protein